MGKMQMGSESRKQVVKPMAILVPQEIIAVSEKIMEKHAETFQKLAEVEKQEVAPIIIERTETIVKEISTVDKRARKYANLIKTSLTDIHYTSVKLLNKRMDLQSQALSNISDQVEILEQRKPEEKQVVIERTIASRVEYKVPKHVYIALGASLLLNILILITK